MTWLIIEIHLVHDRGFQSTDFLETMNSVAVSLVLPSLRRNSTSSDIQFMRRKHAITAKIESVI